VDVLVQNLLTFWKWK